MSRIYYRTINEIPLSSRFEDPDDLVKRLRQLNPDKPYGKQFLNQNGLLSDQLLGDPKLVYTHGHFIGAQVIYLLLQHNQVAQNKFPTTISSKNLADFLHVPVGKVEESVAISVREGMPKPKKGQVGVPFIHDVYVNTPRSVDDAELVNHMGLVDIVLKRLITRLPPHRDKESLRSAGYEGLLDAARTYNRSVRCTFGTYAVPRILGAMLDYLREIDWASRTLRIYQRKTDLATTILSTQLFRSPTNEEIADYMGISLNKLLEIRDMDIKFVTDWRNGDGYGVEDETSRLEIEDPTETNRAFDVAVRKELSGIVRNAVKSLNPRQQQVIELYYYGEMPMLEVAKMIGVSESRVSQIHTGVRLKLREKLEEQIDLY